jgi:undecaprenyl-diphosphatase
VGRTSNEEPPLLSPRQRAFGVLFALGCAVVVGGLGSRVAHTRRGSWVDAIVDSRVQAKLADDQAILTHLIRLADPIPVGIATGVLFVLCLMLHRRRAAVVMVTAIPLAAGLCEVVLKPAIGRTIDAGLAFPSGHAAGAFAVATACAVLLSGPAAAGLQGGVRLLAATSVFSVAVLVSVALVGLGVHYATDTVGGACVGSGMVVFVAVFMDAFTPSPDARANTGGSRADSRPRRKRDGRHRA